MTSSVEPQSQRELAGYEVLVGVCGGIAAYKLCEVVSRLVQRGATVSVAMTRAAQRFVGPTTFQALSGRPVLTDLWSCQAACDVRHIALTGAADLVLIAPATANIIGKISGGIADDVVTTLVISADGPVLFAPAMNDRMWNNTAVQHNTSVLKKRGYELLEPSEGWLACRSVGVGRMADPQQILSAVTKRLTEKPPRSRDSGGDAEA